MASGSGHPTGGRRRKHKSPAATPAELLDPPVLPEYLTGVGQFLSFLGGVFVQNSFPFWVLFFVMCFASCSVKSDVVCVCLSFCQTDTIQFFVCLNLALCGSFFSSALLLVIFDFLGGFAFLHKTSLKTQELENV